MLQNARGLQSTARYVGAMLLTLTAGSFLLGSEHVPDVTRTAPAVVLVIAFVKVGLVTAYFMDIRHAPRWLGTLIHGWTLVTASLVTGLYVSL